jgi:hypothetical protein
MEINLKQLSTQATEASTGAKKMRLSENATSMVFQLFTKNIYSNPIGTVVREITSNCFDSHVEAQVNSPVVIKKSKDPQTDTIYISFIDYGVGMSPDRVENIYGVYFESTKRCDNTQIGGFGIGGKTPLAYKRSTGHGEGEYDNSFYVITNFNGTRYYYCIYEGQEAPEISLLHSEATTERNGTEIRIPVLEKDLNSFSKEMVKQLYYFENVVFEGFEDDYYNGQTLSNEYQIVRGKNFLYRGNEYSHHMHVCLGRVAYPIDYSVLGLSASDYSLPIALKLEVGDIGVVASREQLDYSEKTIKVLKKKLEAAKEEVKELLVKQYSNIVDLKDYFNLKHNFGVLEFKNGMSLTVSNIIKQSDVDLSNFRYSFMKMPNDRQLFKFFFEVKSYGKKPARSRYSSSKYEFEGGYEELKKNSNLLYVNDEFNRKVIKQAYLGYKYDLYHIVTLRNVANNWMRSEIAELFNVHMDKTTDDNGKPIAFVQSLIDMQEEYFSIVRENAQDYDTLEVPEDFIASRKNKKSMSPELRKLTIPVKFIGGHSKERISLSMLFDYNMPIFYGTQENENELRRASDMFRELFDNKAVVRYVDYNGKFNNGYSGKEKNSIMFIMVAQGNVKYFEYCKKAYHVSQFYNKMLYRKTDFIMSYFQTHGMSEQWDSITNFYKDVNYSKLNAPKYQAKVDEIKTYIENLPSSKKDVGYMKSELSRHFDLTNIKQTPEQKRILRLMKEIQDLQVNNQKILSYLNLPWSMENANDTLYDILNKVMVL